MSAITIEVEDDHKISELRRIGQAHLSKERSEMRVRPLGKGTDGKELFGILIIDTQGDHWFDDDTDGEPGSCLAWEEPEDAQLYLNDMVLPNIGMSIIIADHRHRIIMFQSLLESHGQKT